MGPRPRGRGNNMSLHGLPDAGAELQWGRARAGAEIRVIREVGFLCEASMGPRPRGRGNYDDAKWPVNKPNASMGPRPRGRGNRHTLSASRRSFETSLQWGRARAGAEIPIPGSLYCPTAVVASMGPRPRGRGNWQRCSRRITLRRASMGPRPRGRGNTDSDPRPAFATTVLASNGAAPARARKFARFAAGADAISQNLFGFNGAAPARARKFGDGTSTAANASTGPRPRGRGNSCPNLAALSR